MGNSTDPQTPVSSLQVLLLLYWLIFAVGLPLNCLTAWILFRAPVDSGLMVYMKNMVVADLLMVLTFPFKALMEELQLLALYCHYVSVLSSACMYVEILFIGLISLERYGRIFQHASRSPSTSSTCSSRFGLILKLHCLQRPSVARVLAVSTWGVLLCCNLPRVLLSTRDPHNFTYCWELEMQMGNRWHYGTTVFTAFLFWMLLPVMVFCYTSIAVQLYKSNRRVQQDSHNICHKSSRSIFSILAIFSVCFVPYHICRVPFNLNLLKPSLFGRNTNFLLYRLKEGTLLLSCLNVCLNPVIYFLMCKTFREGLRRKVSFRKKRAQTASPLQSVSNFCGERSDLQEIRSSRALRKSESNLLEEPNKYVK